MHWNGRIYESHIIRELVETYANYLTNIHNIDSLSAYKFIDEIVMTLIDYIISNPHGGKAVSAGASQRYIAVIKLPKAMNLSPLFKEIQFEWTVDQKNKTIVLEWFRLVSW